MPNRSDRQRPLAHAVLSTGLAKDTLSFPDTSLWTVVDDLVGHAPNAGHDVRAALEEQQRRAWDAVRASSVA